MYAECMAEIKIRLEVICDFFELKCHSKHIPQTVESIALQVRKILELIAFATLIVNLPKYANHRKKCGKNYTDDWNAKQILKILRKVNARFYPIPRKQVIDSDSGQVTEMKDLRAQYLTPDDFVEVFDSCGSQMLHITNPFSPTEGCVAFLESVIDWLPKITNLLSLHTVQLPADQQQLLVNLGNDFDDCVRVTFLDFDEGASETFTWTPRKASVNLG